MTIGFRILPRRRQVAAEWAERFRTLPVANVSDVMARMTAAGPRLRPMHRGGQMAGPALTVKTRPGDNLMIHKALSLAAPGDVIVVDAGGDLTNALIGELMLGTMVFRKLGGIVLNGAVRDSAELRRQDFPVFAAGVTHRGPYKDGPGEINVPVSVGGMVVNPGDIVVGDMDGLLAIPQTGVEDLIVRARAHLDAEAETIRAMKEGRWSRAFIDALEARCNN